MANRIELLHEVCQGNAYPSMLRDLSLHLGVSIQSLQRLELGWAPIVAFKKGENYQGWWSIPERDETGEVVGLSLRSQTDRKVMYPGSKHGMFFAVNPEHTRGGVAYQHGPRNWERCMEAG